MPPLDDTTRSYSGTTVAEAPNAPPGKLSRDDALKIIREEIPGLSKAGAEGVLRNVARESNFDPKAIGDGGTSGGWFQHHNERWDRLKAFAKDQGGDWQDPRIQARFAGKELKTQFPTLYGQLTTATDPAAAEDAFKRIFERPASVMWGNTPQQLASNKFRFSDYALNEHKGRPNTDVLMMAPQDYLDLSPELEGKPFESPSGRSLKKSVDRGDQIESIPTLDTEVRGNTAVVTDQDGRHRALMAQQNGLTSIPVAVRQNGEGQPTEMQGMTGNVLPHDFPKAEAVPQSAWSKAMGMLIPSAEAATPAAGQAIPDWMKGEVVRPAAQAAPQGGQQPQQQQGLPPWMKGDVVQPASGQQQEQKAEPDYTGWDQPTVKVDPITQQAVPLKNEPGYAYGAILPVRWKPDAQGNAIPGTQELAVPEAIRAPIRGIVEGGQVLTGQRPYDRSIQSDVMAATSLGVGTTPAATLRSVSTIAGQDAWRPMYNIVERIVGGDISKNPGALRIVKRMERDAAAGGPTAQDMLDLLNAAPDKPLTLGDLVGENGAAYLGRLARAPGESRQIVNKALNERDAQAGPRLATDIQDSITNGSAYHVGKDLDKLRKTAARPLYQQAYDHLPLNPDEWAPTGRIGSILDRPSMKSGVRHAIKVAKEEGVDLMQDGINLDAQGEPFFTKVPTWRTLDYIKRGLDDIVEANRDPVTGRLVLDEYGRAANATRAMFRNTLRELNPEYAAALDAYSGPSTSMGAIKAGQGFLNRRPEEIAERLADYGAGDREFFKLGAADALLMRLAKTGKGGDESLKILSNPLMREQLRPLFDNADAYERFINAVEAEGRMFGTRFAALGGSQTGRRVAEDASPELEAVAQVARGLSAAGTHNPLFGLFSLARSANYLNSLRDPAINREAARILTQPLNEGNTRGRLNAFMDLMNSLPATSRTLGRYAPPSSRLMIPADVAVGNALRDRGSK